MDAQRKGMARCIGRIQKCTESLTTVTTTLIKATSGFVTLSKRRSDHDVIREQLVTRMLELSEINDAPGGLLSHPDPGSRGGFLDPSRTAEPGA